MTTIGIIGSGSVGRNIAQAAIRNGYDVVLSNSRGPDTLADLISKLGAHATAETAEEAAARGDFAVVAIPLPAIVDVPVQPLAEKVVLCTINYIPQWFGHVPAIDEGKLTAPEIFQAHLPTSKVVRAFNMLDAADISGDGHPKGDPKRRALAVAGNDPDAKKLAGKLYDEFGFDTLDIGSLGESWRLDPGQPAFVTPQNLADLRENVANAEHDLAWTDERQPPPTRNQATAIS